jgi:hypothetical protein
MLGLAQMNELQKREQEVKCHMQKSSGHSQELPGRGYRHVHKRGQTPQPKGVFLIDATTGASISQVWRTMPQTGATRGRRMCTGLSKDVPH